MGETVEMCTQCLKEGRGRKLAIECAKEIRRRGYIDADEMMTLETLHKEPING